MEENINDELTFRKIWQQIKKSGVRIIVYAVIALIVSGGILGICDIFVSESQYETRITYYYAGVENGENPLGGQEDIASDIKSASNVSAALEKLKYSDEEKDALIGLIIRNLSVVSTVDNEVTNDVGAVLSANYTYKIVLSQDSDIDKLIKSRNDYYNILSAVTSNYVDNFKKKFSINTMIGSISILSSDNAFQKYDTMRGYLDMFIEDAKIKAEMASSFVSTGQNMSFSSLNSQLQMVSQKLENYLNYVLFNGINVNGEKQYVDLMLKESGDKIAIYDEQIEALNKELELIMQGGGTSTPNNGTVVVNPPNVTKLTEDLSEAIRDKALAQAEKNAWETRQNYFNTTDFNNKTEAQKKALIDRATELENEVVNEYNSMVESYKLMIEEYNSGYNISSLVRMTSVPTQSTNSPITVKVGLIVELAVLIIAILVAMIVTSRKGGMKIKKPATVEEEEAVLNENVEGGDEEQIQEAQETEKETEEPIEDTQE